MVFRTCPERVRTLPGEAGRTVIRQLVDGVLRAMIDPRNTVCAFDLAWCRRQIGPYVVDLGRPLIVKNDATLPMVARAWLRATPGGSEPLPVREHTAFMATETTARLWDPNNRLTPWVLLDLERIAWIAEMRASDLTDDERRLLRDVAERFRRVAEQSDE